MTMLMIGIGLAPFRNPGAAQPVATAETATIAPFNRDRALFDSGAARGGNAADIPVAGTTDAADGAQIEARIVDADTGAQVHPWTAIATAAAGSWAGSYPLVPRNAAWLRVQVRVQGGADIAAQANRFGVGHVIAIWGQSEDQYVILKSKETYVGSAVDPATGETLARPPITDDEAVQVTLFTGGKVDVEGVMVDQRTPLHHFVTAADSYTQGVAALANEFIGARPGEKLHVVFNVLEGTGWRLMFGGGTARLFERDTAIHDLATLDGQHIGLAGASWFVEPAGLREGTDEFLMAALFGLDNAGAPIPALTPPNVPPYGYAVPYTAGGGATSATVQNIMADIYDHTTTRWLAFGPHTLPIRDNSLTPAGNLNETRIAASVIAWKSLAGRGAFLPATGLEPRNYRNGDPFAIGAPGVFDINGTNVNNITHPSEWTSDGIQRKARLTVLAYLQAMGLLPFEVPRFNRSLWDPTGAFAEFWFEDSGGATPPITTTRRLRADPPLDPATGAATYTDRTADDYTHWTEVMGFAVNGQFANRAEIVDGRVRVYPQDGAGAFVNTDEIAFGLGAASGMKWVRDDYYFDIWKNLPVIDYAGIGVDGIAVSMLPDPADMVTGRDLVPGLAFTSIPVNSTAFAPAPANVAGGTFTDGNPRNYASGDNRATMFANAGSTVRLVLDLNTVAGIQPGARVVLRIDVAVSSFPGTTGGVGPLAVQAVVDGVQTLTGGNALVRSVTTTAFTAPKDFIEDPALVETVEIVIDSYGSGNRYWGARFTNTHSATLLMTVQNARFAVT